ncbi:MAG: hypothetical protein R3B52_01165 [Candidatus Paceibacterota bacterium]
MNAAIKKDFEALVKNDQLAHGYIFFGSQKAAKEFAHSLVCHLEHGDWDLETQSFSDLFVFDGSQEKLGVEQARTCSKFLSLNPLVSKKRVLLIQSAHKLTPAAQNAILKIAEEPGKDALIILTLQDPSVLLPTLRSRFQEIFFKGDEIDTDRAELREEMQKAAKKLIAEKTNKARSEILKGLIKDEKPFDLFVSSLMQELAKNKMKNAKALAELSRRWALISQYSLNKRLQIESIFQYLG